MNDKRKAKQLQRLYVEISKLDAMEFIGLCTILDLKLVNSKGPKLFNDILIEVGTKYTGLKDKKRADILNLLKQANKAKKEVIEDATESTTEETDSTEEV